MPPADPTTIGIVDWNAVIGLIKALNQTFGPYLTTAIIIGYFVWADKKKNAKVEQITCPDHLGVVEKVTKLGTVIENLLARLEEGDELFKKHTETIANMTTNVAVALKEIEQLGIRMKELRKEMK